MAAQGPGEGGVVGHPLATTAPEMKSPAPVLTELPTSAAPLQAANNDTTAACEAVLAAAELVAEASAHAQLLPSPEELAAACDAVLDQLVAEAVLAEAPARAQLPRRLALLRSADDMAAAAAEAPACPLPQIDPATLHAIIEAPAACGALVAEALTHAAAADPALQEVGFREEGDSNFTDVSPKPQAAAANPAQQGLEGHLVEKFLDLAPLALELPGEAADPALQGFLERGILDLALQAVEPQPGGMALLGEAAGGLGEPAEALAAIGCLLPLKLEPQLSGMAPLGEAAGGSDELAEVLAAIGGLLPALEPQPGGVAAVGKAAAAAAVAALSHLQAGYIPSCLMPAADACVDACEEACAAGWACVRFCRNAARPLFRCSPFAGPAE
ncbi:hypothetical protein WJX81_005005 [Elliptochloris bilobata]|uniref:Uncharacterized protein n=1 Tax=Elliptochloris bilobata TaxID=381761 RepID=A0AAW1S254_9CHLO